MNRRTVLKVLASLPVVGGMTKGASAKGETVYDEVVEMTPERAAELLKARRPGPSPPVLKFEGDPFWFGPSKYWSDPP